MTAVRPWYLIEEHLHVIQYYSVIYLIRCIYIFSCTPTIYLEANTWNTLILVTCWCSIHLYLRGFVLTTPIFFEHGLFAPVFGSMINIVIVIDLWFFQFCNDNYRYRYSYPSRFGLIVPKRFWFRYPPLTAVRITCMVCTY